MLWKILITAAALAVGYLVLKARLRGPLPPSGRERQSAVPDGVGRAIRSIAVAVVVVMVLGSGWYLWRGWEHGHHVLDVQVVNASTGAIATYRARRKDIEGRTVRTLDGREIRLADVERMVLTEPPREP